MEQVNSQIPTDDSPRAELTAMVHAQVYASVRSYLAAALKMNAEAIDPEAVLADIGADSISLTKFVFHLERQFRVTVPDDFTMLSTLAVGDVVDVVTRCVVAVRLQRS